MSPLLIPRHWCKAWAGESPAHRAERVLEGDPQGVAEEGDEDMGLDTGRLLMPDRPDRQLTRERAKRSLDLGELDIAGPQGGRVGGRQIGAQQIGAGSSLVPRMVLRAELPVQTARGSSPRDADVVQASDAGIAFFQPADALVQPVRVRARAPGHLGRHPFERLLQALAGQAPHGLLLLPPRGTAAKDKGLGPVATRNELDLDRLANVLPLTGQQLLLEGPQSRPGRPDEVVRPARTQHCQVAFADDPAVQDPDPLGLAMLGLDRGEDLVQRGDVSPVAVEDLIGQGKPSGLTTNARTTCWQSGR